MFRKCLWTTFLVFALTACSRTWTNLPTMTPGSIWTSGQPGTYVAPPPATPTLSYALPATRGPGSPEIVPTPDAPHFQPGASQGPQTYVVQPGDMLSVIAQKYNVSLEMLASANGIADPNSLVVGQTLNIPIPTPQPTGPGYKLLPDSELVYGPMSGFFDVAAFIQEKHGYLANYTQDVNGETLDAAQIVRLAAANYSVSPRTLLAALEFRSGWVTNPDPAEKENPFGYINDWYSGLYRQLVWASNALNGGYYRWQTGDSVIWVLADGSVVPADPTLNAGTAGVQNFFAQQDDYATWLRDVSPGGFDATYAALFGSPYDLAIDPLVPANLSQPGLVLPFSAGEIWSFTGGPHASWDSGSPYGAIDFAPPGEGVGCIQVEDWVTAVADGLVLRTAEGLVIQDLDGDGNEGSGWVIVYLHVESRDRVEPGTYLRAGDRIGHPSCEGGISSGTHIHLTRKFNGVWIPATGAVPFNLSGWVAFGTGEEYVGTLRRNAVIVESFEGNSTTNKIQR